MDQSDADDERELEGNSIQRMKYTKKEANDALGKKDEY